LLVSAVIANAWNFQIAAITKISAPALRGRGVKFGRPRLVNDQLESEARTLKEKGLGVPEIARRFNLGVSTTYGAPAASG
jgi:hypothetical protein